MVGREVSFCRSLILTPFTNISHFLTMKDQLVDTVPSLGFILHWQADLLWELERFCWVMWSIGDMITGCHSAAMTVPLLSFFTPPPWLNTFSIPQLHSASQYHHLTKAVGNHLRKSSEGSRAWWKQEVAYICDFSLGCAAVRNCQVVKSWTSQHGKDLLWLLTNC